MYYVNLFCFSQEKFKKILANPIGIGIQYNIHNISSNIVRKLETNIVIYLCPYTYT